MSEKRKIVVEIDNLTEAQAIAIEDMLAIWVRLGGLGASRWTSFYADGDGNFHPRITVNKRPAQTTDLITKEERWPSGVSDENGPGLGSEYRIDFDRIAWKLRQ